MIDPYDEAAVVGGNVLTSQRLVDVILKAFEVCAASQVYLTCNIFKIIRHELDRKNEWIFIKY